MYLIELIMGANEIQMFVIKIGKNLGQNCLHFVKKHPYCLCIMLFLCVLCLFFPLGFTILVYCFPVVGLAFLVHRVFIGMQRQKVKNVGLKTKRWKELQSRRSFRPLHRVHVPKSCNESSFMQDQPGVPQNAKERSNGNFNNMSTKNKDTFSTNFDNHLVDEEYRKCSFDNDKDKIEESMDIHEDKEKRKDHGNKTVHWIDEEEKSLMDLGISEAERTKRLECLMERRRSRKVLSCFQIRRNGMGVGIGNNSCGQISSLLIPKKNPFLSKSSRDVNSSVPDSAPSYMVKNNPFDLPYDPHEEKPILTGDSFEDEHSSLGNISPRKSANCNNEPTFDIDFAFKQLRRLGTSRLAKKEDDKKQAEKDSSIPNNVTDDNHAVKEDESSEKVVNSPEQTGGTEENTKEQEIHHDISSDQSTSSSSSSEDEPILRPNKEAILHCLSMSRMRIVSQGNTILRNAESFDCGPSALFDKTKTDGFFFGANKKIHYGSTNSMASDMQVEVSEIGSPTSTNMNFDEDSKGSLVNSTNPSELDLNEMRLRDIDEVSEQDTIDPNALKSDDRRIVAESLNQPVPHSLPSSENNRFQQK